MNETETETVTTTHTHEADNIGEIVTQETIDNEGILDYIIAVW